MLNSIHFRDSISYEDAQKVTEKFQQRQINLFEQAGIDYWPFHCVILEQEKIEKEKSGTTDLFTKNGSILCWTMGNERLAGYGGE